MAEAEERVFYWTPGCPFCLRIHIVLEEHQLKYKSHVLDFEKGELRFHQRELLLRCRGPKQDVGQHACKTRHMQVSALMRTQ